MSANILSPELLSNSPYVVKRAAWERPDDYLPTVGTSATTWAWEFLRRNSMYELGYVSSALAPDEYRKDESRSHRLAPEEAQRLRFAKAAQHEQKIAFGWGLRKLLDPEIKGVDEDAFLPLNEPLVIQPVFTANDLGVGLLNTGSAHIVAEVEVLVRNDQLLVLWNLEGDDTEQIRALNAMLEEIKGSSGRPVKRTRPVQTYSLKPGQEDIPTTLPFYSRIEDRAIRPVAFRIHLNRCKAAVRCLDAYAAERIKKSEELRTECSSNTIDALRYCESFVLTAKMCRNFAKRMADHFNDEGFDQDRNVGTGVVEGSMGSSEPFIWDPEAVLSSLQLGFEYTLNGRYLNLLTKSR